MLWRYFFTVTGSAGEQRSGYWQPLKALRCSCDRFGIAAQREGGKDGWSITETLYVLDFWPCTGIVELRLVAPWVFWRVLFVEDDACVRVAEWL